MALSNLRTNIWFLCVSHLYKVTLYSSSSGRALSGDGVVDAAVSILKHHRSKSRWSYLRSLLTDGNLSSSQFSQIAIQIRNNPHLVLGFFNFTICNSLSSHSLSSYSTIIHILSRARMKFKALDVIKSALRTFSNSQHHKNPIPIALLQSLIKTYRVCDSAPFVFDLLVKACIESKKADAAIEIYSLLKSKHVFLRTSTCNCLIELVSKSKGSFAGYSLYEDIFSTDNDTVSKPRPNPNTLNIVMLGFYREGLIEKVEEAWEEFKRIGCEPNIYSFNILMSAYCDDKRMNEAMKIWEQMNTIKDAISYNTMIGGFCRVGDTEKAEKIYNEMVTNGVDATCVTFDHLITGYCSKGDANSVMILYKDMERRGLSVANATVNAIVRISEGCEGLRIWRVAEKRGDCVLDEENYKGLIRSLCEKGMMEESLKLQGEMVMKGYDPCAELYQAFIDGYVRVGDFDMVTRLRDEMTCRLANKHVLRN